MSKHDFYHVFGIFNKTFYTTLIMFYKSLFQFILMLAFLVLSISAGARECLQLASIFPSGQTFLSWFFDNWFKIALIISEVCALFPGKYSGIVKSLLNLFSEFVKNRAERKKNV